MSVPKTMKALIVQADKTVTVQEVPTPSIGDNDILVKVVAAAQNPTDWKFVDFVTTPGTILGTDWAGNVVAKGSLVTQYEIGDPVAGFTQGGTYTDRGAYAEYAKADAELAWKIPPGTVSFEEAATLGCAFWTAVQGLFHPTRLGLVEPPQKVSKPEWIFVYGGSTSVGMYVLQLAHIAGYKIATVASPKNHELAKSLGADAVFDYRDPDAIKKIKEASGDSIHSAFDTISLAETQAFSVNTFAPGSGKLITILTANEAAQAIRADVKVQSTLIYTSLGMAWANHAASPEDKAHMANFLKYLPELVKNGAVKPNPIKLWEGGLNAVGDGLQYMREGKVSGEKIVYRVS